MAPHVMLWPYPYHLQLVYQHPGYTGGPAQADARNLSLSNVVSPPSGDDEPVPFPPLEQGIHDRFETNSPPNQSQGHAAISGPVPAARASAPQLPARPPFVGTTPQRNYTAPGVQPVGRGSSGAGHSLAEAGTDAVSMSPKNGNWQGGRGGKGKGRHGSYGGHLNDPNFMPQPGDKHPYYQNGPWKGPWRYQAGPQNEAHANTECRNNNATGSFMYRPCACLLCSQRNRSVWVVVNERPDTPVTDVQSRLKYGLGGRFGDVDGVFPIQCHDGVAFIVR